MAAKIISTKTIDEVIDGIASGIPLRQLCRTHGVSKSAWYKMVAESGEEMQGRVARARELGFEELAEEVLEIADDGTNDWMKREGGESLDHEHVSRSKLRIETRLKLLACWDPKRYGNKQIIGSDPENPLPAGFTVNLVRGDAKES